MFVDYVAHKTRCNQESHQPTKNWWALDEQGKKQDQQHKDPYANPNNQHPQEECKQSSALDLHDHFLLCKRWMPKIGGTINNVPMSATAPGFSMIVTMRCFMVYYDMGDEGIEPPTYCA